MQRPPVWTPVRLHRAADLLDRLYGRKDLSNTLLRIAGQKMIFPQPVSLFSTGVGEGVGSFVGATVGVAVAVGVAVGLGVAVGVAVG